MAKQIKQLERRLKLYSDKHVPRATASALNKVTAKAKTRLSQTVVKEVRVPARILKKQIFTGRAKSNSLSAYVKSYLRPISAARLLTEARLAKAAPRGTNRRGVRVAGQQFDGAFINLGRKNRRYYVFQRKNEARYPVKILAIAIDKSITAEQLPIAERIHREEFLRLYRHELAFRAGKL